ncbi:MAG: twin-arginine translocase TatA/TatE family subunit [Dehalococcoidia bacterium]|nr:twin-arginine translocase TatA/TatE family subunit [Dehalococcoidia bacterium]
MNIFGIGMLEILIILIVALIILGPAKTVHMAKNAGRMMGEVRRAFTDLSRAVEEEEREINREVGRNEGPNRAGETPPEEHR